MMFVFRYGDSSPWSEGSYSVHRVIAAHGHGAAVCQPDPGEGYGWLVSSAIVDASTGKVAAIRQFALSRRFSVAVLREYEKQRAREPNEAIHMQQIDRFQQKSTEGLAAAAIDRFV